MYWVVRKDATPAFPGQKGFVGGTMAEPAVILEGVESEESKLEPRGAGVDESPHCYKRLNEVLEAHANSVIILHTLTPVGVAMAGANEWDPYKD
jgi:tRNA-splicing ligase RtcB (3'-phosphate/5'-hydroxy nucleic acid ligase)